MPVYAENKKAFYDYSIVETYEAGFVLYGTEVKSIRQGKISIKGSYVKIIGNEIFLIGTTISPYQPANTSPTYDPERTRKLLLERPEINKLIGKLKERNLTMIPLKVYNKGNRIKISIGLASSKKKYDKRETIKKKEEKRKIERALKNF